MAIRQVGQSPVKLAPLQAGSIDVTTITVEDKLAAKKFGLNILVDIPKLGVEVLSSGFVTTRSFIKKRRGCGSPVHEVNCRRDLFYRMHKARSIEIID